MAFTNINAATPLGSDKGKVLDNEVRDLKAAVKSNLAEVTNYQVNNVQPTVVGLRTPLWDTSGRPAGADLVDRVSGYNSDLGCEEYYDATMATWVKKSAAVTHTHGTAGIEDDAITTVKIVNNAITNDKLADDCVGTAEIIDGAVTVDKMASGALNNNISVLMGTVNNGGTIPLPNGYTQEQCFWMVSPNNGMVNSLDVHGFFCSVNANRVVTSYIDKEGSHYSMTANYIIIGIK